MSLPLPAPMNKPHRKPLDCPDKWWWATSSPKQFCSGFRGLSVPGQPWARTWAWAPWFCGWSRSSRRSLYTTRPTPPGPFWAPSPSASSGPRCSGPPACLQRGDERRGEERRQSSEFSISWTVLRLPPALTLNIRGQNGDASHCVNVRHRNSTLGCFSQCSSGGRK